MKKVLITGANSYIGTSFEKYIRECFFDDYVVDTVDMTVDGWKKLNFAKYDSVLHVAGIAHQKETKQNAHLYYNVNRDLAVETAKKAKAEGVKQFVFLSTMSVYGMDTGVVTRETLPCPKSHYGKSKWEAEQEIMKLTDESFKVCVLRPPMVYGKDCRGNFQTVVKIVKKSPVFPKIENRRSMIYIDNLSSFIKMCIDDNLNGVFCPQNREYVQTAVMASVIAHSLNKKLCFLKSLGFLVRIMIPFVGMARKAFGSLIYKDIESFDYNYCEVCFENSIFKSI